MSKYDIVIKGGTIIDGLQTPRYRNDIAIAGGKVVEISGHIAPEDRPALLAALKGHVIIDLAGLADLRALPGYEGLCW